jgi:hypothetical protein
MAITEDPMTPQKPGGPNAVLVSSYTAQDDSGSDPHLHGLRLVLVFCLNGTMLFLAQAEILIVTISIVAIAESSGLRCGELGAVELFPRIRQYA